MKLLITLLVLGSSTLAHAENWQKIMTCENGAVVVDVNADERRDVQIVFRGNDLLSRLYSAGMVSLQFGQQEYVLRGQHSELRQTSPTETSPQSIGGVFNPSDFKKLIWQDWNGNAYEVENRGSELDFKKLHYTAGQSCTGTFEGECQGAVNHRTYYFDKDYIFRGCSLQ